MVYILAYLFRIGTNRNVSIENLSIYIYMTKSKIVFLRNTRHYFEKICILYIYIYMRVYIYISNVYIENNSMMYTKLYIKGYTKSHVTIDMTIYII